MSKRQDPFRTLDDPDPKPAAAPAEPCEEWTGSIAGRNITRCDYSAPAAGPGHWALPAVRPSWLRRFVVWVLLGWKWHP